MASYGTYETFLYIHPKSLCIKFSPSINISPLKGSLSLVIKFNIVDFPEPLCPIKTTTYPLSAVILKFFNTCLWPECPNDTFLNSIFGGGIYSYVYNIASSCFLKYIIYLLHLIVMVDSTILFSIRHLIISLINMPE